MFLHRMRGLGRRRVFSNRGRGGDFCLGEGGEGEKGRQAGVASDHGNYSEVV